MSESMVSPLNLLRSHSVAPAREECNPVQPASAQVVQHLAHELRQPLSTMESIAYYLEIVIPQQDRRSHKQLAKLQQLVAQMSWILSDSIHYLQAAPSNPQVVDLNEIIAEAMAAHAVEEGSAFASNLADAPIMIRMDLAQCRHMARSALTLFSQMARGAAGVRVSTEVRESEAVLRLCAPAVQMAEGRVEMLFEPFLPHLPAGCGLGLASVRKILEGHGGRASAYSCGRAGTCLEAAVPLAT
jgi:nitrogen fixation/metabolism regulation signal transduction histidine kinase